jgi:hypothetical protein
MKMKKITTLLTIVLCCATVFAQTNNPFNQRGIDYVKSYNIIASDYKAGKITTVSDSTIQYYLTRIPLKTQMTSSQANSVLRTLKTPGFNVYDQITASKFTGDAKKYLLIQ